MKKIFYNTHIIDTVLGPMQAIADDNELFLLEFIDCRGLPKEIDKLINRQKVEILPGITKPIKLIEEELEKYFSGKLKEFKTPIHMLGSDFQKRVWNELIRIPYGETRTYKEQAIAIGNSKSFRAVANANGANQLAIVIPCHRIINSNGELGGYGGGVAKKDWLIKHEKSFFNF